MTVLATAYSDPSNNGTGRDEPQLMVLSYGKGRVFHTTMGHDVSALSSVDFVATFQRGTEWAATAPSRRRFRPRFRPLTRELPGDIAAMEQRHGGGEPSQPGESGGSAAAGNRDAADLSAGTDA